MLMTISTTHSPATDLGYLLHKHPDRVHEAELPFGHAHLFFPEASTERCRAALLLEMNSVELVRRGGGPEGDGGLLQHYVNDRPYVASSLLSVAIARVLGAALKGQSKERPELASTPIPLEVELAVLPCRGGEAFLRRLFEPFGYEIVAEPLPLDPKFPDWGPSRYFHVTLRGTKRLSEVLGHLYVLVPVLDDEKHYWVSADETDKLLRYGESWLSGHPEREVIVSRYLKHQRSLIDDALERLVSEEEAGAGESAVVPGAEESDLERQISLHDQRHAAVLAVLEDSGARSVLDLGCAEGRLLQSLLKVPQFGRIVGLDVAWRSLEKASSRLRLHQLPPLQRERIELLHGSLTYRDSRLADFDAAAVIEVIEHLDMARLAAFERVLFEFARPRTIVLTTPNAEYNVLWETLPAGQFRHRDHRFEWDREQFRRWATQVAGRFGYAVRFQPVGPEDAVLGAPTQMGVFTR